MFTLFLPFFEQNKIFSTSKGSFSVKMIFLWKRKRQGHFCLTEFSTNKWMTIENTA